MLKKACLLILFTFMSASSYGQMNDFDITILLGSPQGDFRDNLDKTAIGLNGSVAFAIPSTPVQIGAELGIMTYGSDVRRENFNPNIPEVRVRVNTSYDIFTGHIFLRYEAPDGLVRPYLDGLLGFNYLFTQTKIQDSQDFDEIASDTNFDDTAFSYGIGGGLKIKVADTGTNQYLINLKGRYLIGSEAEYLQEGSLSVVNGDLVFDSSTSTTNLLTIHLGLTVKF